MSRFGIIDIVIMLFVLIVATTFFMPIISNEKFNYDEADYMFAVSKGFISNYTDSPSIPLVVFFKLGFQKDLNDQERVTYSEFIRKSGDIAFYRHYHGPFYYYYLTILSLVLGKDEKLMRQATFFLLFFCYIIVYLGCFFLEERNARIAALVSSNLLIFSPYLLNASMVITPHSLFLPLAIANLLLMAKIIQSGTPPKKKKTYLLALLVCMALAFFTLENAPILVATLFFCYLLQSSSFKNIFSNTRPYVVISGGLGIVLALMVLCWPGGLFKLTILKNYLFQAYLALQRTHYQAPISSLNVFKNLFSSSPFDLVIVALSFIAGFYWVRKKNLKYLLPFLIFSALIFLLNLSVKNITSALTALYLVTGILCSHYLSEIPRKVSVIVLTIIFSVVFYQNYSFFYKRHQLSTINYINVYDTFLNYLSKNNVVNKKILMPMTFVPTIHYYHPSLDIYSFIPGSTDEQIIRKVKNCNCDGLLYIGTNDKVIYQSIQSVGSFKKYLLSGICENVALLYFSRVQPPSR